MINKNTHNLQFYKEWINTAYENKSWIILGSHSYNTSEFDASLYEAIIEYAIEKGFEIVNIAQTLNIPCKIIKVVSNAITENPETDMAEFQANCHNVMEQNAQNILKCINNFINKYLL